MAEPSAGHGDGHRWFVSSQGGFDVLPDEEQFPPTRRADVVMAFNEDPVLEVVANVPGGVGDALRELLRGEVCRHE
ncbi:conserved hypothetical protein [endosymbiont of unidentified scaly snail isolate Monju]|nr:conserved hypothetical protein [endosymbiont of unidentified scaly snail isolate Monju]